ncbi:MAG: hypothetical protein E7559_09405 [Ruminococcaceae bacterium]|nr:hypothetical protein [Oscillospiraceae bacterium]
MNNYRQKNDIRSTVAESGYASIAASALVFISMALITFFTAKALEANQWFAVILGVSVGVLSFCCMRVWLDGDSLAEESSKAYIILAGTLSFVGIALTYITLNIFPFGDHTVLIIDMHHQYVAFFSLLREKLTGGGSLLYSDSIGLGGGFLPLFAYYLASPFNILTVIFPESLLTEAIAFITMLKVTTAGVTFAIFAKNVLRRNDFSIVVCGVAYSMMAFLLCHSWNIMWLDPILLLPLIAMGLQQLTKTGRPGLYCITLAAALITNYYIGYMICIFMVLYYFALVISDERKLDFYDRARRFWRFCYGSLIGGGISAVIILPAFYYLRSTSGAEDSFARDLATNFNVLALFQRSLYSAYPSMRGDNLPNIYCSVLAVFALVLFLSCRNIPLRKRAAWGGVALVLALSMSVNWLNFAWHGFHFPNDLPYRFSFLLSFTMLCILVQLFGNIDKLTSRGVVGSLIALIAMLLLEQQMGDGKADFTMIYVSMLFIIAYAVITALYSARKLKSGLCFALLLVILFVEVTSNASLLMQQLDSNEYFTERDNFVYDMTIDEATFDAIDSYGDDMYREELLPRKTCNDPALFGYDGMTVFASSNRKSVTTLMGKLGYAVNGVNSYLYKNYVPVSDSVLGLKYVALNKEIKNHNQLQLKETVTSEPNNEGISYSRYIHENTTALSKMFLVKKNIIGWMWDNNNPFIVQNSLMTSACGSEDVFEPVYLYGDSTGMTDYSGYDEMDGDSGEVIIDDANNATTIDGFNSTGSISGTYFSCTKVSDSLDANMTIRYTAAQGGQYFIYVDCRAAESLSVQTRNAVSEEETTISASPNEPNIVDLGYISSGDEIAVTVNSKISCGGNVFLAKLNNDLFEQCIERLRTGEFKAEKYKEGYISGTVESTGDQMMFTSIPYDNGWSVRVDGEKVDTFALGEAFLCFAVPEGVHTVELSYFPSALIVGIIISLICTFILVVLLCPRLRGFFEELLQPIMGNAAGSRKPAPQPIPPVVADDEWDTPFGFEDESDAEEEESETDTDTE